MTDERASLNPRAISPQLPAGVSMGDAPQAVALPEPNLVGQMLDGRYQVMSLLGEGMLSLVYEARHSASGRHFAIKVLRSGLAAKPHLLDRFLQQARAAAQIRHDNVVAIEEFGYTPTGSVYAAIELVVADTLQTILDRDGRWSWSQARPVVLQIATALAAAHNAGLVHRALKPANCFVVLDPRGKRDPFVKVADFGMAQVGVEANQAAPGATTTTLFGDPEYMAPEQGFGGAVTPQTDIYAFGVLLYRFLVGSVPFSNPNAFQVLSQHAQKPVPPLREVDPQIPEAVEQLVMRCLAKAPEQRFTSAAQLEQALSTVPGHAQGGGHAQPAAAPGAGASGPRFARFNAGGAGAAGGPAPPPAVPKQPSVIVAGSIGDGSGGISGTLGDSSPPPYDPYASPGGAPPSPYGGAPPSPYGGAPPSPYGGAPPAPHGGPPPYAASTPSSFLASRPGLRMGLGAAVPSDGPAPPPTVAPGMSMPSPTMAPGSMSSPFSFGSDLGPPSYSPPDAGPGMPPPGAGAGYPPLGAGPGMPPPGAGAGYPPLGAGPGMPPPGAGAGYPPLGSGPGMPPPSVGPGYPSPGVGPGMPPAGGAGPGYPPLGAGPGMPPPGAGPGYPGMGGLPLSQGRGIPPVGGGMPPAGPGYPPIGVGPGMPPRDDEPGSGDGLRRGVGAGMPPRVGMAGAGVGAGMPLRRGMGPGMPPADDRSSSGPNIVSSSPSMPDPNDRNAPGGLGAVEYDEEDAPKRRTLLMVVIGVVVILLGIGLALLIARGLAEPEGEVSKVTRTQKAQDVSIDPAEPEPKDEPEPDEPDEPEKTVKKVVPKKAALTFEQSLANMKGKIRTKCSKLGPSPIDIDTFVDRSGGHANTPKIKQKSPVGNCALRIVEQWDFPASDEDHRVNERVSW